MGAVTRRAREVLPALALIVAGVGTLIARNLDRSLRHPAHPVRRVGVAETFAFGPAKPGQHRLTRLGRERGSRLVIEVDHAAFPARWRDAMRSN